MLSHDMDPELMNSIKAKMEITRKVKNLRRETEELEKRSSMDLDTLMTADKEELQSEIRERYNN